MTLDEIKQAWKMRFQFLIGKLTTVPEPMHHREGAITFQFLIGKLTTVYFALFKTCRKMFQFLIGKLTTTHERRGRIKISCFNSL
ncbi:hypothetical protein DSY2803 [Desulfitobacterium hafniense Y51]|uniref:Uncharacterized protein n=1 Tax=Desulfitobacterium hafniense (strain Y51) TaxID=138119 RepID=Q24TQ0_DESHY|nr:hypothetical protein DSY2803 [Desulfitobacterium hafniense Y51]